MSIEYTIDIQLTELGFPGLLQPPDTSVLEASSHPATSLSNTHKRRLLSLDGEEAGPAKRTTHGKRLPPAQSVHDDQAAHLELSDTTVDVPTAGQTDEPRLIINEKEDEQESVHNGEAAQDGSTEEQQGVEDESDDSEVSDVYEEEEVDVEEDNEEEDRLNNASSPSDCYSCSVCNLQLPSKLELQDHMNLHTGARPYCCAECGKRFCQIYNYRVHLRTHAETKAGRLTCRVCRVSFASQKDLEVHLSKTHFENEFYECDMCKHVFTSLELCESHVRLHKCTLPVVCEVCGRNFSSPKSLVRHRKKLCHRALKCTDCSKTFTRKNALLKHSFSHLGLLPYTCVRCRCHFRLAVLYRQHKCEPERLHCVACLREFVSQQDFQQHKKDTGCWGNQEPKGDEIRCLECGQMFDSSEELKKHAGAHQRVLKCAECGKGFRSALLLMSHMGGHAGQSPCLCQSCGLGFPHQQNYDSHLKTCGKTPKPGSAPKKHPASKTSSSEKRKLSAKPDSSSPANVVAMLAAGSGPPDGLWKLTLDKHPPPGVKLVLFLPVCPTEANSAPLSHAISTHLGADAALGVQPNSPLDLATGIKQDPECEAPLDLSKKCNSSKSALSDIPLHTVKNEHQEFEISGETNGTEKQVRKSSDTEAIVTTNPGEADTEVKQCKMDQMDLSPLNTSSELIVDIKKEPQSDGSDCDLGSAKSC
ncbi:oocyte zinc finger protein XlCOF28 [Hippoglossus hippoglossus]|uniref:oocyte zinc finger protein XlCOF28 n=1 Tax=Hippoglossus hippoglossus TaxID=8267 RepID=UPI00148E43BE|nr:oocyte zinc finger protein XlCOF28 [Hippoglossus hippoglossus]